MCWLEGYLTILEWIDLSQVHKSLECFWSVWGNDTDFLWRQVISGFHSHPCQLSVLLRDAGMVEGEAGQACWCWSMVCMVHWYSLGAGCATADHWPPLVLCTPVHCVHCSGPVAGSQHPTELSQTSHRGAGDTDTSLPPCQAPSLATSIKHTFTDWFIISFMWYGRKKSS